LDDVDSLQPRLRVEAVERLACVSEEYLRVVRPPLGGQPLAVLELDDGEVEGKLEGAELSGRGREVAVGARVVARAWADPSYKARLLADGTAAVKEFGFTGFELNTLVAVENSPASIARSPRSPWSDARANGSETCADNVSSRARAASVGCPRAMRMLRVLKSRRISSSDATRSSACAAWSPARKEASGAVVRSPVPWAATAASASTD